jgi:RNA polymerase sigma factor (sigma-70 family)
MGEPLRTADRESKLTAIEHGRAKRSKGMGFTNESSSTQSSRSTGIEQIFNQFGDPVYRFIYRQVGNQQDAEDLTSEVFLSASRSLDVSRPENSVGRWLFTVSRTVIADHWRKYYRVPPLVDIDDLQLAEFTPVSDGEEKAEKKSRMLTRVLDGLPEHYRVVLELRFLKGYTLTETAIELDISVENAKVRQHRALAKAVQLVDEHP